MRTVKQPIPKSSFTAKELRDWQAALYLVNVCVGFLDSDSFAAVQRRTFKTNQSYYIFIWLLRTKHEWTLTRIAEAVGRDRTTIMHTVDLVTQRVNDQKLDALL